METGAIIISVVAIGIALATGGFAIWLQWKMFQASTQQLGEAQQVLSKLEGVSLQMRETQERQFEAVLRAALGHDAEEAATVVREGLAELERRLEEQATEADIEDLKAAVADVREKNIEDLKAAVADLREKTRALESPAVPLRATFGTGEGELGLTDPTLIRAVMGIDERLRQLARRTLEEQEGPVGPEEGEEEKKGPVGPAGP